MFARAKCVGHARRGMQFGAMPLAVVNGQAVAFIILLARDGKHGGGIKTAGKQHDRTLHVWILAGYTRFALSAASA